MARTIGVLLLLGWLSGVAAAQVDVLGLFNGKALLEIDGKSRLLAVGETSPEGVKLLSADSRAAEVEVDGVRQRLELGSRISSRFAAPAVASVYIWPDGMGMYTVMGSVNGLPVRFLVDTGASDMALNAAEARRLGIDYQRKGRRALVNTASGTVPVYQVMLDKVTVGEISMANVSAMVLEGEHPQQVLLGMSFLGQLELQRQGPAMVLRKKW